MHVYTVKWSWNSKFLIGNILIYMKRMLEDALHISSKQYSMLTIVTFWMPDQYVCVCVYVCMYTSFGYILRHRLAVPYGSTFKFLRHLCTNIYNGYIYLYSNYWYITDFFHLTFWSTFIFCIFDNSHPNRYELIAYWPLDWC